MAYGTGKTGARLKDEDSLEDIIQVNDHDRLLFFTNEGQASALNAYEIPESSRTASGSTITQASPFINFFWLTNQHTVPTN